MEAVVVHVSERSSLEANKPTATELENFFRLSLYPVAGQARWVGPSLRIVRENVVGATITHAAWLLEADNRDAVARMLQELNTRLQAFSRDFSPPGWQRYEEGFHGPVEWWADGNAALTRTRDRPPNAMENTLPFLQENPVGPNTNPIFPVAVGVGVFMLLGGALYMGIKAGSRERQLEAPPHRAPRQLPAPRQNPRRRRH